ncbi:MAG TPA: biotin--[acetyl-CoA-carboxylase] ligase [Megamonas hypermegale]|uniref:Bifunctional ligase/repressor BirA n=1 Tax=Megamonas hypermegale TaxID=158847 RepID=A0A921HNC9_9FIRM|nr:biotin--[acetyl-CoA-carboxylase] ligase [Megamonas hypermegale]MDM8142857.1 biotin--[acetyl-CoA-carboxylase] ligase [Megamonas hypermegale]HJF84415.1 biotin--[acetyl-CoA-carboxylase] ligase [Megamonas hypermegale]
MRSQILNLLKQAGDNFLSGEYLAETLNVSRTAIWKHIKALRDSGYDIESVPRNGYRLLHSPDLLSAEEVKNSLSTKILGSDIKYFTTTDSTNNQAKKLALDGAVDGTIVISEEQNGGRGRLSRSFFCPKYKGIWFSVILRPDFLPQEAPKCTLLAAVAVTKAIYDVTGVKVGIKWPNDILYNGKKLVGILTEMSAEMERINYIVLGIGIDVNISVEETPEDIRDIMTSLSQITGKKVSRLELLNKLLYHLEQLYIMAQKQSFAPILDEWRKYSITLNQEIKVISGNDVTYGEAVDIDDDGALLVKINGQIKRVLAGDVSIRPR